ncbi:MAG: DUF2132 domain-containing protein [Deltaproteobacteria bacterium]|nr:DUF2132 domain-containing protein [Planctomycetota bacterium]MBM4282514.1 DUF2132 domain-containing protein [Deltaproteobacteria bacterium]
MTLSQPRNPLHGITLEAMVNDLVAFFGWDELGRRIPIRCFQSDPSVSSSLKFLRKTPWAREKVEGLYLFVQRERRRRAARAPATATAADPPQPGRDELDDDDDRDDDDRDEG